MMTEEKKLTPEQLTEILTIAAADLCWIGAAEDDPSLLELEAALPLVARAWELPETHLQERMALIRGTQEVIRKRAGGERAASPIPEEKLMVSMGRDDILPVLDALKETRCRMNCMEEWEQLRGLSRFLADYWGLREEMEPREYLNTMMRM